jgi:hypothetical protein
MTQLANRCTLFLFLLLILAAGCQKDGRDDTATGTIKISLQHQVNSQPLVLAANTYTNAAGEQFNITTFKYYLSNFSFTNTDGNVVKYPGKYYLVNEAVNESKTISIDNVPLGDYKSVSFTIGVDSVRNVSGAQTGALDPLNGMFWSWNSGYIMAKLEGSSPVSKAADKSLVFHIGGFKGEYNALRNVTIATAGISVPAKAHVTLVADAAKWFGQPNAISFKDIATIHVPGTDASKIAENYSKMFTSFTVAE